MSDRPSEAEIREKKRRDWAALQVPELVTTQQAVRMFGRISFPKFREFMSVNGIGAKVFHEFTNAFFYDKAEVAEAAEKYLKVNPPKGRANIKNKVLEPDSPSYVGFGRIPDRNWTYDQFMLAWGKTLYANSAADLLNRAKSFYKLKPVEAFNLMLLLIHLNDKPHRVFGFKVDAISFRKAVKNYVAHQRSHGISILEEDVYFVRDLALSLHRNTDIGVFNPDIVIAILFELRTSRVSKN